MTDTMTPLTPDWTAAFARFRRTVVDHPDTISLTDTLTATGISRDDYWCIHRHGMWPFAPVGFAATGRGGPDEPYYRRSEVDAWMERNRDANALYHGRGATNGPNRQNPLPDATSARTDDFSDSERRAA